MTTDVGRLAAADTQLGSGDGLSSLADGPTLARAVTDAPSAVLLVELDGGRVVYANDVARQLAPSLPLPVDLSVWSEHAGLRDADGEPVEATATPLGRVAAGHPVNGEMVTAQRRSDVSAAREKLWVIGTPMDDAPGSLGRHALVVLLPLRDAAAVATAQSNAADLRHRAVIASQLAFSITDPNRDDDPLVWVNPAFQQTTGYDAASVIGRNCRFLQGPLTDPATVQRIGDRLRAGLSVNETLLNYRADGTAFWNHLTISPVFDAAGQRTHHVAVQTDVTERVDTQLALQAALERAETSSARQRAVASIGAALSSSIGSPGKLLADLPTLIAEHFSGWCATVALDTNSKAEDVFVAAAPDTVAGHDFSRDEAHLLAYVRTRQADITAAIDDPTTQWPLIFHLEATPTATDDPDAAVAAFDALFTPLIARDVITGLLVLIRTRNGFADAEERTALADLAMRAGIAFDNARLFSAARDTALTLQRSLLPTLPRLERFDVAASYVPASGETVGGDWFDVVDLPGPWIGAAVGDVIGHDMNAAARMGQLRSMVRTLAWEGHQPAVLITRLDGLIRDLGTTSFATVLYALIDDPQPTADSAVIDRSVTYTSAGHLPAMMRTPDGAVVRLEQARTSPVGIQDHRIVDQARVAMPPGSVLVLYTDGLIERRDRDLDCGFDALEAVLRSVPADASADTINEAITEALVSLDPADDTCVLVIRSLPTAP